MTFIRPLYTCGAFNRQVQRAVMYNTARGTCYTFEGVSSLLVNEVLASERESPIDTAHIAAATRSATPIAGIFSTICTNVIWQ